MPDIGFDLGESPEEVVNNPRELAKVLRNVQNFSVALAELTGTTDDLTEGVTTVQMTSAERTKLASTEIFTTADETKLDALSLDLYLRLTLLSPSSSEDITVGYIDKASTIQEMVAVLTGTTPSVTWTLRHAADRSASGNEVVTSGTTTTNTTTGESITSFDDATIPANSFVWLETSATSGTVDSFHIDIIYRAD